MKSSRQLERNGTEKQVRLQYSWYRGMAISVREVAGAMGRDDLPED